MSTYLRVPCQSCGPVKVPTEAVLIRHTTSGDQLEWTCPCGIQASWRPHPVYRGFLDASRIHVREVWEDVPAEMADPLRQRPVTPWAEDVIDAVAVMWWERLKGADIMAEIEKTNNQEGK